MYGVGGGGSGCVEGGRGLVLKGSGGGGGTGHDVGVIGGGGVLAIRKLYSISKSITCCFELTPI